MNFRRYPDYKPSGNGWLGDVPLDWNVYKLANATIFESGRREDGFECSEARIYSIGGEHIQAGAFYLENNPRYLPEQFWANLGQGKITPGDILLVKDGATLGKTMLVTDMPSQKMAVNEHVFVVRPRKGFLSPYLHYCLQTPLAQQQIWQTVMGSAQPGINRAFAKAVLFTAPHSAHQQQIITFLDRETTKIDTLIARQEQLIELLKEKRQAVISHAVTKGIDRNVSMKPSGVEWLGDVPEHWIVRRLKHLVHEGIAGPYGSSLTKSMYSGSDYRVYGQQQVIPDDFSVGDYYISTDKFSEMTRYAVRPNDILISVMGTIGRAALVPVDAEPGIINPRLVLYRAIEHIILPRYLQLFINNPTTQRYFSLVAQGTTMEGLNMVSIGELQVALPTRPEQVEIIAYLDKATSKIDTLISKAQHAITLQKEHRSALISAAVTGKIDVHNEVAERKAA